MNIHFSNIYILGALVRFQADGLDGLAERSNGSLRHTIQHAKVGCKQDSLIVQSQPVERWQSLLILVSNLTWRSSLAKLSAEMRQAHLLLDIVQGFPEKLAMIM